MEELPLDSFVLITASDGMYLRAMPDKVSIGQGWYDLTTEAEWKIEYSDRENFFRLRGPYGRYLGVSETPHCFSLGFSSAEVVQKYVPTGDSSSIDWKLDRCSRKSRFLQTRILTDDSKPLRANPFRFPWYGSVTHGGLVLSNKWINWDILKFPTSKNPFPHGEQVVVFEVATDYDGQTIKYGRTSIVFEGLRIQQLAWMIEAKSGFPNLVVCTMNDDTGQFLPLEHVPSDHITMVLAVITEPKGIIIT